jgi:hypothetical protein
MSQPAASESRSAARPLGVWLLTIYAFFFAGLAPLALAIGLFGHASSELGFGLPGLVVSASLSVGIAAASVGAWRGIRKAKNTLILLVTIHYAVIAFNNFVFMVIGEEGMGSQAQLMGRVIRGVLYPAIYIWYFRRPFPKDFYGESHLLGGR